MLKTRTPNTLDPMTHRALRQLELLSEFPLGQIVLLKPIGEERPVGVIAYRAHLVANIGQLNLDVNRSPILLHPGKYETLVKLLVQF
jgi:hypothetical protein